MYLPGGMYLVLGVYLVTGDVPGLGAVPGPRGCTCPGGVYLVGGVVHLPRRCTCLGGIPGPRGGVPGQVLPPCGHTHACKNITFATSLWMVISPPWSVHNYLN